MKFFLAHFFAFLTGLMLGLGLATLYAEPFRWTLSVGTIAPLGFAITALGTTLNKFDMLNPSMSAIPLGISLLAGLKLLAFAMAPDSMWNWVQDPAAARNLQLTAIIAVMLAPLAMGVLHAWVYAPGRKAG